jgi:hypothetical protein
MRYIAAKVAMTFWDAIGGDDEHEESEDDDTQVFLFFLLHPLETDEVSAPTHTINN